MAAGIRHDEVRHVVGFRSMYVSFAWVCTIQTGLWRRTSYHLSPVLVESHRTNHPYYSSARGTVQQCVGDGYDACSMYYTCRRDHDLYGSSSSRSSTERNLPL